MVSLLVVGDVTKMVSERKVCLRVMFLGHLGVGEIIKWYQNHGFENDARWAMLDVNETKVLE
jgi:hypothetical protein